jgi:hypothetical protein
MDYKFISQLSWIDSYYPARVAQVVVINGGFVAKMIWKGLRRFLSEIGRNSFHFIDTSELDRFIAPSLLPTAWGGPNSVQLPEKYVNLLGNPIEQQEASADELRRSLETELELDPEEILDFDLID